MSGIWSENHKQGINFSRFSRTFYHKQGQGFKVRAAAPYPNLGRVPPPRPLHWLVDFKLFLNHDRLVLYASVRQLTAVQPNSSENKMNWKTKCSQENSVGKKRQQSLSTFKSPQSSSGGRGVLPYIGYTGIWKGYGFQAIYSGIRSSNHRKCGLK